MDRSPRLLERGDISFQRYQNERTDHWDSISRKLDQWKTWGGAYHNRLEQVYSSIIPPGLKILELGCGDGGLLAALNSSFGVGIDLSAGMIQRASLKHPNLLFVQADAHALCFHGSFDVVILSDLINELWDLQAVLREIQSVIHARTRIIINSYNRMWELPLRVTERLGLAKPSLNLNWFTVDDVHNQFDLEGYESIRHWEEFLLPFRIPFLSGFFNRFLIRFWPFRLFALTNFTVARSIMDVETGRKAPSVSVVIPTRNEAGNIEDIFFRVPEMGKETQLVFVEGHSRDDTYEVIEQTIRDHPERSCLLLRQSGEGKGDAVRLGFEKASGDILLILDADLTVPPEDLPRFYEVLRSGKAEFVNGVRLVYPIEDEAMRYLNLMGNKFFSLAFSWLLGQSIKDTLCGTKGLWKCDYDLIAANRSHFGSLDPFGDFDLIFGAVRLNKKIVDLPIRYRKRSYGETNIRRWEHGWLLMRMLSIAARKIKFI